MIIEVCWSVRWRGYDRTGHKMFALDLETENTLKVGMYTYARLVMTKNVYLFPTCDDKGVDDETHTGNTSSGFSLLFDLCVNIL